MPQLDSYELTFHAGLHVGEHGIGQEPALWHVPADTLFAALVAMRAQSGSDAGAWAAQFLSDPPFRLTSAFPFAGAVRFYPAPLLPLTAPANLGKRLRKIKFVSTAILQHWLNGTMPAELWPNFEDKPEEGGLLQDGAFWLARSEIEQLPKAMQIRHRGDWAWRAIQAQSVCAETTVPRVQVDRLSNTANIFHTGRVTFAPGCGLWFGVAWHNTEGRTEFEALLHALGEAGLGAERSAGYGAFRCAAGGSVRWAEAPANGHMLLLSRYSPRAEELELLASPPVAYELVRVAGRTRRAGVADQRRKAVTLLKEGSVVAASVRGGIADVTPAIGPQPHRVYRYGWALGLALPGAGGAA